VGDINIKYDVSTRTSIDRLTGNPSLFYQLALTSDPGNGVRQWTGGNNTVTKGNTFSLDTNVRLPKQATLTTRYQKTENTSQSSSLSSSNSTTRWPDLDMSWGQLYRVLKLDKMFQSFQANTRYTREKARQPNESISSDFSPLLRINATFRSGLSATLDTSVRSSTSTPAGGGSESRSGTRKIALTMKKTLNRTRKVTVPMTNRVQTMQTRMDLSGGLEIQGRKEETRRPGEKPNLRFDTSSWKFNAGLTYQFTQSFNGTGSINFGQNTDNKNKFSTTRFIGLNFSAGFTF